MNNQQLVERITQIIGTANCVSHADDVQPYVTNAGVIATQVVALVEAHHRPATLPWRPIEELTCWRPCPECVEPTDCGSWQACEKGWVQQEGKYGDEAGFLLLAPELVDGDCNAHGVGMAYWQDYRDVHCDPVHGRIDDPETDSLYRTRILERLGEDRENHPRYYDAQTLTGRMLDALGASLGVIRDEYGGWLACKWSMQNDEWREVKCTPTHYLRLTGVAK